MQENRSFDSYFGTYLCIPRQTDRRFHVMPIT
jgi:phospholipase C